MRYSRSAGLLAGPAYLACAACASAPSVPERAVERAVFTDVEGEVHRTRDIVRAPAVTVPVPPTQAWDAVVGAYEELGVEVRLQDRAASQVGNRRFFRTGKLGGEPLSAYLDCGGSTVSGPRADSYRIALSLVSTVTREGDGTRLETELTGEGRPLDVSGDPVHCASTERLEGRLARMVLARVRS